MVWMVLMAAMDQKLDAGGCGVRVGLDGIQGPPFPHCWEQHWYTAESTYVSEDCIRVILFVTPWAVFRSDYVIRVGQPDRSTPPGCHISCLPVTRLLSLTKHRAINGPSTASIRASGE